MQSPSEQFNGMKLSRFRQYCANHDSPFCRKEYKGQPFWTTSDGKIIWLKETPINENLINKSLIKYELQTGTLNDYCQKPLVQRGVAIFDQYYAPRKPDTPILKRRAKVLQQVRSYSTHSYIPPRNEPKGISKHFTRTIHSRKPEKHSIGQQKPQSPPMEKTQGSSNTQAPVRLVEAVSEIAYGGLPERIGHFMQRAAKELPQTSNQTENRWFGMNASGHLIMTQSSRFSFLFPNTAIRHFIKFYSSSLARKVREINLKRSWYQLPPIKVQVPEKERHCHAEILQKQLSAIAQVTDSGFKGCMQQNLKDIAQLLDYYPDSSRKIPPVITEKLKQTCQLIQDWMQCSSLTEHSKIVDVYMKGIWDLCHNKTLQTHSPDLLANINKTAPLLLQNQLRKTQEKVKRNPDSKISSSMD